MKTLIDFALYSFATFGLTYIAGHASASQWIRQTIFDKGGIVGRIFVAALECPACLSFHIGWLTVAFDLQPGFIVRSVFGAILYALAMTGTSYVLARFTQLIPAEASPTNEEKV